MIHKAGSDKYRLFYSILNGNELGHLKMVYTSKIENAINAPVLLANHSNEISHYDPGYLDINGVFSPCPICIHFIQIKKIIENTKGRKTTEIHINIYNKHFSEYRSEIIKSTSGMHNISHILNNINIYIDREYKLENLDIQKVFRTSRYIPEKIIIPAIYKIQFTFFENSKYVPQKDNIFWEEIEVRNFRAGTYINDLILQGLKKHCYNIEVTEYGLLMICDKERWALPNYDRKQIEKISEIEERNDYIKGCLLIDVIAKYDHDEHMCKEMIARNGGSQRLP